MNTEKLKQYVRAAANEAASCLGGITKVRELHQSINMVQFLSGWLCGLVAGDATLATWRIHRQDTISQEEIRRISDYVRLVIETDSTGSS